MPIGAPILCPENAKKSTSSISRLIFRCAINCAASSKINPLKPAFLSFCTVSICSLPVTFESPVKATIFTSALCSPTDFNFIYSATTSSQIKTCSPYLSVNGNILLWCESRLIKIFPSPINSLTPFATKFIASVVFLVKITSSAPAPIYSATLARVWFSNLVDCSLILYNPLNGLAFSVL